MEKIGSHSHTHGRPTKRVSVKRLLLTVLIISGLSYFGTVFILNKLREIKAESDNYESWFAAYVDVTSVPAYKFEKQESEGTHNVILSFIVSSNTEPCIPSWGGYYTMDEAAVALDLDRRIARLQKQGGRMSVSFGGALNSEMAIGCKNNASLLSAYSSVIDRYNINTIDLDLENEGLTDIEALKRRADVIAELQRSYRESGRDLAIWLTLPVTPHGMTVAGTDAVAYMLKSRVDLAGVNVMVMDYGGSKDVEDSMFEASKKSLLETHRQLDVLYTNAGIKFSPASLWKKIGATPMIGQNDVLGEIFTIENAEALNILAYSLGIGRISMWSANRDIPCGENYVDLRVVSDACSGVTAEQNAFAHALGSRFTGDLLQDTKMITVSNPEINYHPKDDPEKSPYQIWRETGAYRRGTKVVWHGNVYEAKWWTQGELPDNPVLQLWETPWQLIGPVLEGEKPIQLPTLPPGTYPTWSGTVIYNAGDRVLFDSAPFQAKWWNQGQSPAASEENFDSSPWELLTKEEVQKILDSLNR